MPGNGITVKEEGSNTAGLDWLLPSKSRYFIYMAYYALVAYGLSVSFGIAVGLIFCMFNLMRVLDKWINNVSASVLTQVYFRFTDMLILVFLFFYYLFDKRTYLLCPFILIAFIVRIFYAWDDVKRYVPIKKLIDRLYF